MSMYLRAKFRVCSIILTSFRQGGGGHFTNLPTSKQTPKRSIQIRVEVKFDAYNNVNIQNSMVIFTFSVFDQKCPISSNLVQKIKIVNLN